MKFKFSSGNEVLPLREMEQRIRALDRILEFLKSLPELEKQARVESLLGELGRAGHAPEPLMLTWDELRRMQGEGWGIGSHTVSHPILSRIDQTQVRQELRDSKHALESHLQIPVEFLAYPNGKRTDFNPAVKVLARECGFQGAVTTLGGFNAEPLDLFEIGRQSPWDDHLARFAVKLSWHFWRAMSACRSTVRSNLKIKETTP